MLSLIVVTSLCFLCFLPKCSLNETRRTTNFEMGILGGVPSEEGDHPHLVSLQLDDHNHFCAGSLIDELHVVTAAHCIFSHNGGLIDKYRLQIQAGDVSISKTIVGRKRAIRLAALIFVHKDYSEDSVRNDIGVLRLNMPLNMDKLSKSRALSSINLNDESTAEDTICKVAGWGKTSPESNMPLMQIKVDLNILPNKICHKAYPRVFKSPHMFCAGSYYGGKDSCKGDSGGGLVCDGLLTGVVSFGYVCGLKDYPGVYTNVSYYKDWIKKCTSFKGYQDDILLPWFRNSAPRNLKDISMLLFALTVILD